MVWVENNYQLSVKYQTLHKQLQTPMKAKLKVPEPLSNKKDELAAREFKKTIKITKSILLVGVCHPQSLKKKSQILVSR